MPKSPRNLVFAIVVIAVIVAINWPVYSFFGSIEPYILGFPLSFAWIILWLTVMFFAVFLYFITDPEKE